MKKFLLLASIFVCTLSLAQTTYAKQKDTPSAAAVTTVGNAIDTSSNFKMVYNDVKSSIAGLASALKVGAEHVYIVLIKQQVVKAVSDLLLVILMITLSFVLYRLARKTYDAHLIECGYKDDGTGKSNYGIDIDDSAKGIISVVLTVGSCITFIVGVCMFCATYNEIITGFINPEYGAMKDIMEFAQIASGK